MNRAMLYGYVLAKVNPGTDPEEFDWDPEEQPAFFDLEEAKRELAQRREHDRFGGWSDVAVVRITLERAD